MENDVDTRKKIILSTLELINNEGTENLTVRKIATKAGVNNAAINYHFQSKENLIEQTFVYFTSNIDYLIKILDDKSISHEDKLYRFMNVFIEKLSEYTGIIRSHIGQILQKKSNPVGLQIIKDIFPRIRNVVSDITNIRDESKINMIVVQTMSSLIYPILVYDIINEMVDINVISIDNRDTYIRNIIQSIKSHMDV